jgi:trimethylamine--corrinoid protein Co-methyltransferase
VEIILGYLPDSLPELVHEKTVEILTQVGFCVPVPDVLKRLETAGLLVDEQTHMVRITPELLETALQRLPKNVRLYDRTGENPAPFETTCFMGAGTPVNVFDLETDQQRPATRQDVRNLVTLRMLCPRLTSCDLP